MPKSSWLAPAPFAVDPARGLRRRARSLPAAVADDGSRELARDNFGTLPWTSAADRVCCRRMPPRCREHLMPGFIQIIRPRTSAAVSAPGTRDLDGYDWLVTGQRRMTPRGRRPGRPGTLPVLRALLLRLRAPRDHLAAAHRASLLLSMVSAVARRRHLRPRAGHRQLRKNHVPPTRLARHPGTDGALTGPDTVRPVVCAWPGLSLRPVRRPNAFCPWSRRRRPRYGRRFR